MEGISKAFIDGICASEFETKCEIVDFLKEHCKELNPWLLIDEKTPRDKCLWLSNGKNKCLAIWFQDSWRVIVWIHNTNHDPNFTHYQELPEDPK